MQANTLRTRLLLGVGVAAVAAVAATGAFGVSSSDKITTFAGIYKFGIGGFSGDGGPAAKAQLGQPHGVAVDKQGNVYIADSRNQRIRKVSLDGKITTIAGGGRNYIESGPATSAYFDHPSDVAVDGQGNVYITDRSFVYQLSPGGILTRVAGSVNGGFSGDGGPAAKAELRQPSEVAVDQRGNVYIADTRNHRVRKVSGGIITTVAGTGVAGFSGDGGPATSAKLNIPEGVEVDGQGNVYIADRFNSRVRKVSLSGTITTVAGNGTNAVVAVNGRATATPLSNPWGVAIDAQGNLYISTDANVYKVSPGGTITKVAGLDPHELSKGSGDGGPATSATLAHATAMAFDAQGNLYIADAANAAIRKIWNGSAVAAPLKLTLGGVSTKGLLAQKGITVTATCGTPCSLSATGSVTILGTRYAFRLTSTTASRAAAKRTLTLRFPAAEQGRFRRLLRPGQQARAVIIVKATDSAGLSTTSKRTVAVASTSAKTTQPSTPASSGTATLRTFVARIENVLRQSAAGRRELAVALAAGFNCSISPGAAAQRTGRVVDNRRSVLRQLGALQSPDRQARVALGLLRSALQHSITADLHYRDGFSNVTNSGCPLPSNASFALARRSDALASYAKQRFVAVFNQLARRVDRRTWSATEI